MVRTEAFASMLFRLAIVSTVNSSPSFSPGSTSSRSCGVFSLKSAMLPPASASACESGAAVPARPKLLASIIRAAVKAAGSVPITIKTRLGVDEEHLTAGELDALAKRIKEKR